MNLLEELGLKGPYSKLPRPDQLRYQREYRKRNKDRFNQNNRKNYDSEKAAIAWKKFVEKHGDKLKAKRKQAAEIRKQTKVCKRKFLTESERREYRRTYSNQRYHADPQYRIASRLRTRLNEILKNRNQQKSKTLKIDKQGIVAWVESKFQPGMTWSNHGKEWHLDHILPCAEFDLPTQNKLNNVLGI